MGPTKLRWVMSVAVLLLGAALAACTLISAPNPTVTPVGQTTPELTPGAFSVSGRLWLDACAASHESQTPPAGCSVENGTYKANGFFDPGESALGGVPVTLGKGACPSADLTTTLTDAEGVYSFKGLSAGTYCVTVDFLFVKNITTLPGRWTRPAGSGESNIASIIFTLPAEDGKSDLDFGWELLPPTSTPVPPTPTVTTTPTPSPPGCVDKATLLSEATTPADIPAGASFVKTWRLRNDGACTWNTSYSLAFINGDALGGSPLIAFPAAVAPGAVVDLSVALTAPVNSGTYISEWQLRNAKGVLFGVGPNANDFLHAQIVITPTTTPQPTPTATPAVLWRGEYYANRDLSGTASLTRSDQAVNFDWGNAAPDAGLPADGFSARWTSKLFLPGGTYRFYINSDDGVRFWLDDGLVIDQWHSATATTYSAERILTAAKHSLRVEYYEDSGTAQIQLWWVRLEDFPQWRGEYYSNPDLKGAPVLVRNDAALDFDWNQNAPATAVPGDHFSVRWTQASNFDGGTYRFHILVDDGARLLVDGQTILNEWHEGGEREAITDFAVVQGLHTIQLEYYENAVDARIRLWWEPVGSPVYTDWKGEYWSNRDMSGNPALVRNDLAIDFNWKTDPPAPLMPVDGFSARWSRQITFGGGTYRFSARADDGIRIYLDGALVLDEWHASDGQTTYTFTRDLNGPHGIIVQYYEDSGPAQVKVSWELQPTPTPTRTSTPTLTPTP